MENWIGDLNARDSRCCEFGYADWSLTAYVAKLLGIGTSL